VIGKENSAYLSMPGDANIETGQLFFTVVNLCGSPNFYLFYT
jgi:hypothetical protein